MLLDEILPRYEFGERHETRISAPPRQVRETLLALSPSDTRLSQALLTIRLLPRVFSGRLVTPGGGRPLVDFMADYGFAPLAETENEIVYGIVDRFWRLSTRPVGLKGREDFTSFDRPDYAKAAFNFVFASAGAGTHVVTETRIHALSPDAHRKFAAYWLVIRAGSGLIRHDLLAALKRRAERG